MSDPYNALTETFDGSVAGKNLAVKDNICTLEGRTTAASKLLQDFSSPYEATAVRRLKQAGFHVAAKANCDEFAMGSSTEYSAFGVVKNPWDQSRVAGGSSGGSAVAVAAGLVDLALGTDTGGSIRQPASFCNVVGLKPTYGRVSRFGAIAYGSSFDQIGPFARTVRQAADVLQAMSGCDELDATSSPLPVPAFTAKLDQDLSQLTIGVPQEFFTTGLDSDVEQIIRQAISDLEGQGLTIKEISLPLTDAAVAVYYLIAKAEASSNLARYDGLRYGKFDAPVEDLLDHYRTVRGQGFGPEVTRAILMGTHALSAGYSDAWYKQAAKVRTLIQKDYEQAFVDIDLIACPVSPEPAFKIGSKSDDPLAMYLADALTVPFSVAGLPALSVPAGFTSENLPVGLQLAAPHFKEGLILQVAHHYEQDHNWYTLTPEN